MRYFEFNLRRINSSMIEVKEITQLEALKYMAARYFDNVLNKASNKFNIYILHTINGNYELKGNDETKDMKGEVFRWCDRAKNSWIGAYENGVCVGVQWFRLLETIGWMYDGYRHGESNEIIIKMSNWLYSKTKHRIKINYSDITEGDMIWADKDEPLTVKDLEEKAGYKAWAWVDYPNYNAYYRVNMLKDIINDPSKFDNKELTKKPLRLTFLKRLGDLDEGLKDYTLKD
tara:strand:- start:1927 stop:2619 length:693 start_codon:yes stop_codon:yes gene_type:complete